MVSMLDRLVKSGFVQRQPSETDRRVKLVVLTEAGMQVYDTVRKEADSFRKELLQGIDADQLLAATELLEALQAATEKSA
jgi:MarR family transcriptional regulator for hemolysin